MFKRIFVVEDDLDISELLEFNLKRKGYDVQTYSDGTKAYEAILENLPDLVILDLTLPGLTGMDICRYMRHNRRTKKIPIIMLTARTAERDRLEGLKNGANRFITKPFSIRDVMAHIQDLATTKQSV